MEIAALFEHELQSRRASTSVKGKRNMKQPQYMGSSQTSAPYFPGHQENSL